MTTHSVCTGEATGNVHYWEQDYGGAGHRGFFINSGQSNWYVPPHPWGPDCNNTRRVKRRRGMRGSLRGFSVVEVVRMPEAPTREEWAAALQYAQQKYGAGTVDTDHSLPELDGVHRSDGPPEATDPPGVGAR